MTKPRAPRTFAEAAALIGGRLGYDEAGALVDRAGRTVYEWANPDSDTAPSLEQARKLDAAYLATGVDAAPFRDAYDFQLERTIERRDACRRLLTAEVADLASEAGQAVAAALVMLNPGASPLDAHRASAEAAQVDAALDRVQRRLASFLPIGAGPVAGSTGGTHQ